MTTQNQVVGGALLLQEIIDNASDLSINSQEWLLTLAKGMALTRKNLTEKCTEQ